MKSLKKIASLVGVATLMLTTQAAMAANSAYGNVSGNGVSFGQMAVNFANGLINSTTALEAFEYFMGVVFLIWSIMSLVKWKKSEGRDASMGLIAVLFLCCVGCFCGPSLVGSGITTAYGTSQVQTIKAPTFTSN